MNALVKPPLPPMSGEQRSMLRRAVATSPGWKLYRDNHAISMDKMNNETLWTAAYDLGVDAVATINGQTGTSYQHKPRPFGPDLVYKLKDRFDAVQYQLEPKERQFCSDIFTTIYKKQGFEATGNQYATIDRIVTKAEQAARPPHSPAEPVQVPPAIHEPVQAPASPEPSHGLYKAPAKSPAEQIAEILQGIGKPQLDEGAIEALIDAKVKAALAGIPSVTLSLQINNGPVATLPGQHHHMFPELLRALSARNAHGEPLNIWIAGPAGSGKTSAAMNCAKALGLSFHANGAVTSSFELFGFIDAGGTYHRTPFRDAYEHGGVYIFDDTDGSDPNATTAFNMPLANGHCAFPDRIVERHPDCVIIATGNTWGNGATADYVGRNRLDGAFLDRFGVKLPWDYDVALECAMSGNSEWAHRVIAARNRARAAGLKVLITPRASIAGAALIAAGFSADKAAEYTYLANLTAEQRNMVEGR